MLAVPLIDLAIFGSLGTLWIGGTIFIVVLYRWIARFERDEATTAEHVEVQASAEQAPITWVSDADPAVVETELLAS